MVSELPKNIYAYLYYSCKYLYSSLLYHLSNLALFFLGGPVKCGCGCGKPVINFGHVISTKNDYRVFCSNDCMLEHLQSREMKNLIERENPLLN